jgi:hypothetical protein
MGYIRHAYNTLVGKPEGKKHVEDLRVDGRIVLEWISSEWGGKVWNGCI